MIVFPNAKINIGLHIVSKRTDGYHNLETVFFPLKIADALEMVESNDFSFSVSGIALEGSADDNLVLKAWKLLKNDFDLPPVQFHLHKTIPAGAGLGGGSSDAAFTLKVVNDFFDLDLSNDRLKAYARKLGADCPFFIDNLPAMATGIGDQLQPLEIDLSAYQIVVLKPQCSVSTAEAYRNVQPAKSLFDLRQLEKLPLEQWKDVVVNGFEKSVFPLYPEIGKYKEFLYQQGALFASMSGSGAAVFGIFRHLPADFDNLIPEGVLIYR